MELLFCNCCSFSQNTVNGLRTWDVGNVGYMSSMIDCLCMNDVTTIDLSDWDVSNVIDMSYMLEYNTELKYLNLNNWILNEKVDTTELFLKSNNLEKVSIMNSNAFTINKIIAELPTRTSNSMGTLNIEGIDDYTQVDTTTTQSKYWNVVNE
jgi:surface protein